MSRMNQKILSKNLDGKIFCPKCKSLNVINNMNHTYLHGSSQNFICENCGYSGMIFPKLIKEKIRIKK